jgi:predicted aldo/keto reductase-like oxidoreductase
MLIVRFVSLLFVRSEQLNVQCLESVVDYAENVATYLKNKPKQFVLHCMHRLPSASEVKIADITDHGDGCYTVISATDHSFAYNVMIGDSASDMHSPKCDCTD